jgi:hypothetical protein
LIAGRNTKRLRRIGARRNHIGAISAHIGVIAAQGYAVEADDIRGRAVEKLQTVD